MTGRVIDLESQCVCSYTGNRCSCWKTHLPSKRKGGDIWLL